MSFAHHPYVFSHQWFELHPQWRAKFKTYAPRLGLGAVLASAALLIWSIHSMLDMPLTDAEAMSAVVDEIFVPTGLSGYLPPHF